VFQHITRKIRKPTINIVYVPIHNDQKKPNCKNQFGSAEACGAAGGAAGGGVYCKLIK
jgi:hypothetical protein